MILAYHFPNLASYRERLDTKLKRKKEKKISLPFKADHEEAIRN